MIFFHVFHANIPPHYDNTAHYPPQNIDRCTKLHQYHANISLVADVKRQNYAWISFHRKYFFACCIKNPECETLILHVHYSFDIFFKNIWPILMVLMIWVGLMMHYMWWEAFVIRKIAVLLRVRSTISHDTKCSPKLWVRLWDDGGISLVQNVFIISW